MRTYLRLLRYLKPYRGRLAAALACMALYAAASTISLGALSPFLQVLFRPADTRATASAAAAPVTASAPEGLKAPAPLQQWVDRTIVQVPRVVALGRICVFLLIVLFVKNVADYVQGIWMVRVEQAAIRDIRDELQGTLQRLSLSFFHTQRTGVLLSRITNDVEYLRNALAAGISTLVKDGLTLMGFLGIAFFVSWRLTLLALLVVPAATVGLQLMGRKMRGRSGHAQERMGDLTAHLQETITGARVVRAFGAEPYERRRFARANQSFYNAYVRMRRVAVLVRPVSEYGLVLVAIAMLWFGGRESILHDTPAPHDFILFITALMAMVSPTRSLAEVNANLHQGIAAAERLFALLDTKSEVLERPLAPALPAFRDRVRYEQVTFAYGEGPPVLEEVSFDIPRGRIVALVGSSGAGKSTAMDLLPRFYDPTGGRITVDGTDLRDVALASLRAQLGIVTQDTFLFHDTVRANIAYGAPDASDEAIHQAAQAAHAHGFVKNLPQGYDTVIGDRGVRLSGGERQRLAIARALLRNPPILLLDEATSALDAESERLVQQALEALMRDRTVLVIAHRLSTVQHADHIVVLEGGRVAATGTHRELMSVGGLYRRLYDLQFVA